MSAPRAPSGAFARRGRPGVRVAAAMTIHGACYRSRRHVGDHALDYLEVLDAFGFHQVKWRDSSPYDSVTIDSHGEARIP